jgi:hypothetical protein
MLVPVSMTEEMHQRASQKKQVRQRGQDVTGVGPQQICSERCEQEADQQSKLGAEEVQDGIHGGLLDLNY